MARIDEGEQEADGDGLDPVLLDETPGRLHDTGLVQLVHHAAAVVEPALHPGNQVAANHRLGARVLEVVHVRVGHVGAADEEDVPEPLVGDDADPGAASFQHGVQSQGRAVGEQHGPLERGPEPGDGVEHTVRGLARRGRRLAEPERAGRRVQLDGIHECSADVDGKP